VVNRGLVLAVLLGVTCACNRVPERVSAGTRQARPESRSGIVRLSEGSPKLDRIRVEPVRNAEFALEEVIVPGKVEANPNRISRVLTPVAGRVRRVLVQLGEAVAEGQPVVAVESAEVGAALAAHTQAQSELRQARSALNKAEADVARVKDLYAHRAVAQKELLTAENEARQQQFEVEQRESAATETVHRLEMLGIEPAHHTHELLVRAPISGKVLEIAVAPGEHRNDTASTLMTIADLSTVWITAQVPEGSIRHIQMNEAVHVTLSAYPGEEFHARVTRIADTVDPQTRSVKVHAQLANPGGRLRPEMFGEIRHGHASTLVPAVPVSAIIAASGRSLVLVERRRGEYEERFIETGARRADLMAVPSGLSPGERIVVDGAMLLRRKEEPR
jgi:membrane fusion protein, heavy metal efflux system